MSSMAMSCALRGISGVPVTVEADISSGLPQFIIVGLTDRAIQESRERVRVALRNGGFDFPQRRLTVNLAPAELPKEGTAFDLPIALAVLRSAGVEFDLRDTAIVGELALDASVRPVAGVLPMAWSLRAAGVRRLVVPAANAAEAGLVDGLEVVGVPSLSACVRHLDGSRLLGDPEESRAPEPPPPAHEVDIGDVRGHGMAKRAVEIAAAGGHNLLLVGPPGAGKTMLARALGSLLPDLEREESLEVAAVYSVKGALQERSPSCRRAPFRAPHHSVSRAGLVGGGAGLARPGELSLAHRGVLFLDELCEFPRGHLEALRQPLEERRVTIGRARGSVALPADFALVAAGNPCPCGFLGDAGRPCRCSPQIVIAYEARLSGPLRDRLDLVVTVPRQPYADLFAPSPAEPSDAVRERIELARRRQRRRNPARPTGGTRLNAAVPAGRLLDVCRPAPAARSALAATGERLSLSARGYHRVLRVARTIADLDGSESVEVEHVEEAVQHRGEGGG